LTTEQKSLSFQNSPFSNMAIIECTAEKVVRQASRSIILMETLIAKNKTQCRSNFAESCYVISKIFLGI